ncbi:MAG TPA: CPBP family intramembrane glutamic endopeptidase [Rhodanobacteraceae bacterium]|nr:CPBP family intramembrane glutamic endopeptidase [Rhodanobacteraceae bacterium]
MPVEATSVIDSTPSPTPRRPGIWGGLGVVVLYPVLQLIVAVALGLFAAIGYGIALGLQGSRTTTAAVRHAFQSPDVKTGFTVATIAVVAVLMLWIIRRQWRGQWTVASPPGFGFVRPQESVWFLYAVLTGVAVALLGGVLTQWLAHGHEVQQDVTVMGRHVSLGMRVALAALVVCVAPLVEELIFRGVLLSGLMRYMKAGWAVTLSALIFGCVHLPDFKFVWYAIPALILLGAVLAWLRLHSRSLWPAVAAHAFNNLMATIGWFVAAHPHA